MAKKSISKLKKQLDTLFSKYIRMRDRVSGEYCRCITCGKAINWKYECDAGHFQSRSKLSTRFDERNVNSQCKGCNNWGSGEQYKHGKAIDEKYGEGTAEQLEGMPKDGFKIDRVDYELMLLYYKKKIGEME